MHPHLAEVPPKSRLHERPCRDVERLARRAQHFMNDRRRFDPARAGGASGLQPDLCMFRFGMFLLTVVAGSTTSAFTLEAGNPAENYTGCRSAANIRARL